MKNTIQNQKSLFSFVATISMNTLHMMMKVFIFPTTNFTLLANVIRIDVAF